MSRPLVVVEPKTHRRLRIIDALRAIHRIDPLDSLDGALRHIRVHRPTIVVLGVGRRTEPALRLARQIRTDGSTPALIGLIDWDRRIGDPSAVATACGAAGVFCGTPTNEEMTAFVGALGTGAPLVHGDPAPRKRAWFFNR